MGNSEAVPAAVGVEHPEQAYQVNVERREDMFLRIRLAGNECLRHLQPLPLNFFCRTCSVPICSDCCICDHKPSDGHKIEDLITALISYFEQFERLKEEKVQARERFLIGMSELQRVKENQVNREQFVATLIETEFQRYHEILESRKQSLLDELSNRRIEREHNLESAITNARQSFDNLSLHLNNFDSSVRSGDVLQIFRSYSQLQGSNITIADVLRPNLSEEIAYVNRKEKEFLSVTNDLGEVSSVFNRL